MPAREQALEDVARDRGADGFAEAQVEVEEGLEAERLEHVAVGLLGAEVRGHRVGGGGRRELLGDQGGSAAVGAVEDDELMMECCAEDDAGDAAELKAADLGEDVDGVLGVGLVDLQRAAHDAYLLLEALVGDVRAAARDFFGRFVAGDCGNCGARRRVGDAHLAGQEPVEALGDEGIGDEKADFDGVHSLFARHGGAFGHVLRAIGDARLEEARHIARVGGDAHVVDEQARSGTGRERVGGGSLAYRVVAHHLERRLLRIGADALGGDAVVGAADDDSLARCSGVQLIADVEPVEEHRSEAP